MFSFEPGELRCRGSLYIERNALRAGETKMASNRSAFESPLAVDNYAQTTSLGLYEPEKTAFAYLDGIARDSVLDIGIGAGRTVPYLSAKFGDYTGVDYSAPLIATAKRRFPDHRLLVMDAQRLEFPHQFDAIVFSYNGIDYLDESGRRMTLERIASKLRPEGLFIYSTHNLHYARVETWMQSFWVRELGHGRALAHRLPRRMARYWRQWRSDGFAYVNDPGLGFSLMTRYSDASHEMEALRGLGFSIEAVIGATRTSPGYDESDGWFYLVARRLS